MKEKITLNEDQLKLINEIKNIEERTEPLKIVFSGSAGTGKTTTIISALELLQNKKCKTIILTPTHQSGIVVKKMLLENNMECPVNTIHSYFEIKPEINDKGRKVFIPKLKEIDIEEDVFIIDESSMIDDSLFNIIIKNLIGKHLVFVGDKYQLPPVGLNFSPVFSNDERIKKFKKINLEKVQRTKNDGVKRFEQLRNFIKEFEEENKKRTFSEIYDLLSYFNLFNESEFAKYFNLFIEERFKNKKRAINGSFTNNFVNYYNLHFRNFDEEIEDKVEKYSKGDRLILNDSYNFLCFGNKDKIIPENYFFSASNILKNGEEVRVKEAHRKQLQIDKVFDLKRVYNIICNDRLKECQLNFPVLTDKLNQRKLLLDVWQIESEDKKIFLTTDSEETNAFIQELFELAKLYNFKEKNKGKRKQFWKIIYSLSEKIIKCNYSYASTIHKLQGQTVDEIFIDMRDFTQLYDKDYNLFLRLLYVAITRTSNKVFILK